MDGSIVRVVGNRLDQMTDMLPGQMSDMPPDQMSDMPRDQVSDTPTKTSVLSSESTQCLDEHLSPDPGLVSTIPGETSK